MDTRGHDIEVSDFTPQELKDRKERTYKLIAYLLMAAVTIMFGGWISAIVVSSMDKIWVNFKLPSSFWLSTGIIILSSVILILGISAVKKGNQTKGKFLVLGSLILGLLFGVFQFRGFKQLIDKQLYWAGQGVYFQKSAYGNDFILLKNDEPIQFDGEFYYLESDTIEGTEKSQMQEFCGRICENDRKYIQKKYQLPEYGNPFSIAILDKVNEGAHHELTLKNGVFYSEGEQLPENDLIKLFYFSYAVKNDVGFFNLRGEYGEDFTISLNGTTLDFYDKRFYFPEEVMTDEEVKKLENDVYIGGKTYTVKNGKIFSGGNELQASELEFNFIDEVSGDEIYLDHGTWYRMGDEISTGQYNEFYSASNQASSYLWVITVMHLLHILAGVILLTIITVRTFKGKYNQEYNTGLRVGGMLWHYLGVLWIVIIGFWKFYTI